MPSSGVTQHRVSELAVLWRLQNTLSVGLPQPENRSLGGIRPRGGAAKATR